jgi:hypothetical protein
MSSDLKLMATHVLGYAQHSLNCETRKGPGCACNCGLGDAYRWAKQVVEKPEEEPPPQHAFEMSVKIGGNTWEDTINMLGDVALHVKMHGHHCGISSGGWGGCYSVDIQRREVEPDAYRAELGAWTERQRAKKESV